MRKTKSKLRCVFFKSVMIPLLFLSYLNLYSNDYSPLKYGVNKNNSGIENYYKLYKCHNDALKNNGKVDYCGIDTIYVSIPKNASPIPLPEFTDFAGVVLCVENHSKKMALFEMKNETSRLTYNHNNKNSFFSETLKNNTEYILVLVDSIPWIEERRGFGKSFYRKDVLYVQNGTVQLNPIYKYDNATSKLHVSIIKTDDSEKKICNLKFIRSENSSKIITLLSISGQNKLSIENITSITPGNNKLYGDGIIGISNSTNIELKNIHINGSYSQKDKYGYGICLSGVSNITIKRISGKAPWGIFYVDNSQNVLVDDCDINRFDLHCYGKDFTIKKSTFSGRPNAYASFYGTLIYDNCTFNDSDPIGLRQDYNANTPFDAIFNNCTFNFTQNANCILRINGLSSEMNSRKELHNKCLPNLHINNCEVNFSKDTYRWFIAVTGKIQWNVPIDYMLNWDIQNIYVNGDKPFDLFSSEINTKNKSCINLKNIIVNDGCSKESIELTHLTFGDNISVLLNGTQIKRTAYTLGIKSSYVFLSCTLLTLLVLSNTFFKLKNKKQVTI